ncbi:MAG: hypothetical protein M3O30_17010 [Planctomycetota bacterium]|nr:hypothetical protein [Planctomycetota bacterium]
MHTRTNHHPFMHDVRNRRAAREIPISLHMPVQNSRSTNSLQVRPNDEPMIEPDSPAHDLSQSDPAEVADDQSFPADQHTLSDTDTTTSPQANYATDLSQAAQAAGAALGNPAAPGNAASTLNNQTQPDGKAFNQAVEKFDHALNDLPTIAVVKF